jgi:hypothetical protein
MCRETLRIFFVRVVYSNHCVGFKPTGGFLFCVNFATVAVVLTMGHSKGFAPADIYRCIYQSKVMA